MPFTSTRSFVRDGIVSVEVTETDDIGRQVGEIVAVPVAATKAFTAAHDAIVAAVLADRAGKVDDAKAAKQADPDAPIDLTPIPIILEAEIKL